MAGKKYDLSQRVQAFTFLGMGMRIEDVGRITGFSRSALYDLKKRAIERGYDHTVTPVLYNVHVEDAKKSGRPGISLENQQEIIAKVSKDQHGREKSTLEIAAEVKVSQSSVARILTK